MTNLLKKSSDSNLVNIKLYGNSNINDFNRFYVPAFTLSEVLITIVIIGVIAAITVPAVLSSTEKQEFVSKLKKAYSTLQQSTYKIAVDTGYPVGDFSFVNSNGFFDLFQKQLNVDKICPSAGQVCFYPGYVKFLDGSNARIFDLGNSLVTMDGISYGWEPAASCSAKGLNAQDEQKCIGRFVVDINGLRPPNTEGRDIFFFLVVDGKGILPAGNSDSSDCVKGGRGITCAARVLRENKMSY